MSEVQLAKITVTSSADTQLNQIIELVNRNFTAGRITKPDVASWLINRGAQGFDEAAVKSIQRAHFSQVTYLDSLVKKLKSTGQESLSPDELVEMQAMFNDLAAKKRSTVSEKPWEEFFSQ